MDKAKYDSSMVEWDSDDRCTVCGTSQKQLHDYNGELFCNQHLQDRIAREV